MISWIVDTAINTTFTMTSPLADVVHSLCGSYSQATCSLWTYHQDNHIDSCRTLLLLTFRMHAKTVVTSFTCALVSSVTVSTSHVRTLPQGPGVSKQNGVFTSVITSGCTELAHCTLDPHWKRSRLLLIFVVLRATACTCCTAEKRACFIQAVVKREEILFATE